MPLQTVAERSGYRATSTHAAVMAFIEELKQLRSPLLHVTSFGQTPQGRELPLLVLSSQGVTDPASARRLGRPVLLLQNCIHAGEVEGKEAALMLMRDLLQGREADLLDRVTIGVVPIFNADGNDAMDTTNRALHIERLFGQDGPPRVGTRVNAAGINLNRDYIKQEALEMRLLQTRVCQPWQPDVTVDSHATNGSVHRFAMTHDIPHTVQSGRREPIDFMRHTLVPEISLAVHSGFGLDSGWYGNFVEDERALDSHREADPACTVAEGWMTYPHHPRFGSNYRGLGGRLDLLLECYSYLTFEERVRTTYAWLLETARAVARRGDEILDLVQDSRTPPRQVAVRYHIEAMPQPIDVLTRQPRTRQGAPHTVRIPFLSRFVGDVLIDRPRAYALPAQLSGFLRGHGLHIEQAAQAQARAAVATFEGWKHVGGRAILEAAGVRHCQVTWQEQARCIPPDWIVVPTEQPLGALAVYLCEPESDDGLFENGLLPTPEPGQPFPVLRLLD